MLFRYKTLSEKGKTVRDVLEADSIDEAKLSLHRKGIAIIDISEFKQKSKKVPLKEILVFVQELSKLLKAGLPLYDALLTLEEKHERSNLRSIILDLLSQIKNGRALSDALAKYPATFDPLFFSMIKNAEKTGALDATLDEIYLIFSKKLALYKQLVAAFTYPAILLLFCLIVLTSLFFFIIPSLFDLFEGRSLLPITSVVLTLSHFLTENISLLLTGLLALFALALLPLFVKPLKRRLMEFIFTLPFLRSLFLKMAIARFSRAFASLLAGGVSYLEALSLAKAVMRHPLLERDVAKAAASVMEGKRLSELLKGFPPLAVRMLSVAEESGSESFMLKHLALIYEEDVERSLQQFAAILQPAILLFLGVVVGMVILSVLLPLTDVSSIMGDT